MIRDSDGNEEKVGDSTRNAVIAKEQMIKDSTCVFALE
jgi:hypothetical protein